MLSFESDARTFTVTGDWTTLTVVAVLLTALIVTGALALKSGLGGQVWERLKGLHADLRLGAVPMPAFVVGLGLWAGIMVVLILGLFGILLDVIVEPVPPRDDAWTFRFKLAQIAALTAVLGAVIALPIKLNSIRLARDQTDTAEQALFNTKISEAAADLHTQRQVTKKDKDRKRETVWEDDIVRRNAAIDRIEGLVKEDPTIAERVARLLSVYLRELSREHPAVPVPEEEDPDRLYDWARGLRPARSDMENAAKVLGRLTQTAGLTENTLSIDLRHCNLQGFDLAGLDFRACDFREAQLQGADLWGAQLQGTRLVDAQLQGARLVEARLQEARLVDARLQGTVFTDAQFQGADLRRAKVQGARLVDARLQGADLRGAQLQGAKLVGAQLQGADLKAARLEEAILLRAQLQGADLWDARLQGAVLTEARLDDATDLTAATFKEAAVKSVDKATLTRLRPFWPEIFCDGSVPVPEAGRPRHWPVEELDLMQFVDEWNKWRGDPAVYIPPQDRP